MSRRKSSTCAALLGLLTPALVQAAPLDNVVRQATASCSNLTPVTNALTGYSGSGAVCAGLLGQDSKVTTVTAAASGLSTVTSIVPVTTGTLTITLPAATVTA